MIKFNLKGNLFAVFNCTSKEIKIYDVGNDILSLASKIEKDENFFSLKVNKDVDDLYQYFKEVRTLKFDLEDRFIYLNNNKEVIVINIKSKEHKIHPIDLQKYDGIAGMKMKSSDEENYQLFVVT